MGTTISCITRHIGCSRQKAETWLYWQEVLILSRKGPHARKDRGCSSSSGLLRPRKFVHRYIWSRTRFSESNGGSGYIMARCATFWWGIQRKVSWYCVCLWGVWGARRCDQFTELLIQTLLKVKFEIIKFENVDFEISSFRPYLKFKWRGRADCYGIGCV